MQPAFVGEESDTVPVTLHTYYAGEEVALRVGNDPEVGASCIQCLEAVVSTGHLAEGIASEYDQETRPAGTDIMDAAKRFGAPNILRRIALEDIDLVRA
ncbi:MAG: hypothetical protein QHJ34_11575 [bacterium]|nr:hypothetical protein [candidate division KSB1 bacterium]MDH7560853.1 hypothetical protein [bacterium]